MFQPKVPLLVNTPTIYGEDRRGESVFLVWDGAGGRVERHSRKPGFWCAEPDGYVAESAPKRRLSNTAAEPATWHRIEFDSDAEARDYVAARKQEGYGSYLGDVDRYITRIIIEDPAYFARFPMTRSLRILALDIEQRTDGTGGFPPRDAPITSIAHDYLGAAKPQTRLAARGADDEPDDFPCLALFKEAVEAFDPDIIAGFNVNYDLGVLAARGAVHGFPLESWGRLDSNGNRARSLTRTEKVGNHFDEVHYVGGRIIWDLRANANPVSDYNLSGCKDFKLKTIAEFLGWPVVRGNTKNTLKEWREDPEKHAAYNANDADLVRRMVERYLPDRLAMAEFFGAPLDMTIDSGSGWAGTIAAGRSNFEQGIVTDGTNLERHRKYLMTKRELAARGVQAPVGERAFPGIVGEESDEDEDEEFVKPQGAYVAIHKRGLFKPLYKVDFASLYPNVIVAVGCGPDNTRIVGTTALGPFEVRGAMDARILSIPDENYRHNWLIEVRGKSRFVDTVAARMKDRLAAKYAGDDTRATVLKTLLNSLCFGVHGAHSNRYGTLPLLIIATGVPRELIKEVGRIAADKRIETDTDGIYLTERVPVALMTRAANKVAEGFGFEPRFKLDFDEIEAGWFHEAKQYLLLKKGKLLRIGGAMKGSSHPAVFDQVINRVGNKLLREGRASALTEARACLDLDAFERSDFIQRMRLGKNIESYAHQTKEVKLARLYERLFQTPPKAGRSYEYVRTREGVVPPTDENLAQIDDYAYLSKVILPALERLGFADMDELGIAGRLELVKAQSKRSGDEVSLASFT